MTLKEEFAARVERLRAQGLVHMTSTVDVGNHTTTPDLLAVLNNVMRLQEEGNIKPTFSYQPPKTIVF